MLVQVSIYYQVRYLGVDIVNSGAQILVQVSAYWLTCPDIGLGV